MHDLLPPNFFLSESFQLDEQVIGAFQIFFGPQTLTVIEWSRQVICRLGCIAILIVFVILLFKLAVRIRSRQDYKQCQ